MYMSLNILSRRLQLWSKYIVIIHNIVTVNAEEDYYSGLSAGRLLLTESIGRILKILSNDAKRRNLTRVTLYLIHKNKKESKLIQIKH